MLRYSRVACGLCCLLMMALSTSALLWLGDRLLALGSGEAFGLFDETRYGLSTELVGALWAQGAWMWLLTSFAYPFLHVSLALELGREDPAYDTSALGAFFRTVVPVLSSLGAARLYDELGRALERAGVPARGARVRALGGRGASALLVGGVGAFATIFATALPLDVARVVVVIGFSLPFLLPPLARLALFVTLLRALRELALKRAARDARAGFSAPVGG